MYSHDINVSLDRVGDYLAVLTSPRSLSSAILTLSLRLLLVFIREVMHVEASNLIPFVSINIKAASVCL